MSKVVIIDDHARFRERLNSFVHQLHGCAVAGLAADTQSGLDLVRNTRPDVVLIDVGLADESGLNLAERLAEMELGVRIILMGENETVEYERAAEKAGASAYVSKTEISQSLPALLQPRPHTVSPRKVAFHGGHTLAPLQTAMSGSGTHAHRLAPSVAHFAWLEALLSGSVLLGGIALDQPATAMAGVIGFAFLSYRQTTLPRLPSGHVGKRVLHRIRIR